MGKPERENVLKVARDYFQMFKETSSMYYQSKFWEFKVWDGRNKNKRQIQ